MVVNIADKRKAIKHKWRIKESTLWIIGLLGGATMSYLTMITIRHKTKHKSFMIFMPIIAIIQIIATIFIYRYLTMGG